MDPSSSVAVCDLDGTLVDSDRALADAFVAHGVRRADVTYGHVLADECARLGISVASYLAAYDPATVEPFPGVVELVEALGRWAVCSNKHRVAGRAELARFGWEPEVACFADAFEGGPKRLAPVLEALALGADEVVFVGDTAHDRACAAEAGCRFVLAAWNPRAVPAPGDLVAHHPGDVVAFLTR